MGLVEILINYKWTFLFYIAVILLIYYNRATFDWPARFVGLYRTKVGIKLMERMSRHQRFFKVFGDVAIVVGFIGMLFICGTLVKGLYELVFVPGALPVVGSGGVDAATTGLATGGGGGMVSSTESHTAPLLHTSPDASQSHSHSHSAEAPRGQIMAERISATRIFIGRRTFIELVSTFALLTVRFFFISLPPGADSVVSFRSSCFR